MLVRAVGRDGRMGVDFRQSSQHNFHVFSALGQPGAKQANLREDRTHACSLHGVLPDGRGIRDETPRQALPRLKQDSRQIMPAGLNAERGLSLRHVGLFIQVCGAAVRSRRGLDACFVGWRDC